MVIEIFATYRTYKEQVSEPKIFMLQMREISGIGCMRSDFALV